MSALTRARDQARLRLAEPPPGPFRPSFWRSPLRGPWLTSFLGSLLVPVIVIQLLTGLLSHWAYQPGLAHNATTPNARDIPDLLVLPMSWPSWSYAFTQGIHVTLGLMTIPLILAKLWSVIPRLFAWPAVKSPAAAIERLALLVLVSSVLVEFVTGTLDVEYWYPWHFDFYTIHYYGAWVFSISFALHALVKLPTVRRAYRERGLLAPLMNDLAHTEPEPPDPDGLVAVTPAKPTISRRGLLGMVGGSSLTILVVEVGQSVGGPLRRVALLAARGRDFGSGPNDFQITTTAGSAQITPQMTGAAWRLSLTGGTRDVSFSREQLLALPQHEATLTISCVEGWSTTQHWRGVRLADLRRIAGAADGSGVEVDSIQPAGSFRHIALSADQVEADDTLLALHVNGVELSPDHGYPARVIVPGAPGVHNTKWVGLMRFFIA
jgi:DMSO/TMAO reductase YedYZ molybdopterin-dependent catalytic subunit